MKNHIIILIAFVGLALMNSCKKDDPQPTADFSFTGSGCTAPCAVLFENKSKDATDYSWDFGDGTTSTETNPTKTYNVGGTYNVTLTATGKGGTASTSKQVLIQNSVQSQLPTASFTISNNGCTASCAVSFTNTSTNATSYDWNFGDGSTSTSASPSHTYTSGGTYTVTLVATNAAGTNQAQQSVTIQSAPTKVRITKITVSQFPATDGTGASWDNNPLTSNYLADVYATITLQDNTVLYSVSNSVRQECASPGASFSWTINYLHSNLATPIYVDLWDYDDTSSDDYIGWTGPWQFNTYTTYPTTKIVTANGISVTLNLQWE